MEIINIGHADGNYCENERNSVRRIANCLHLGEGVVEKIEQWVDRGIEHAKTGQKIILGEG